VGGGGWLGLGAKEQEELRVFTETRKKWGRAGSGEGRGGKKKVISGVTVLFLKRKEGRREGHSMGTERRNGGRRGQKSEEESVSRERRMFLSAEGGEGRSRWGGQPAETPSWLERRERLWGRDQ